MYGWHEKLTDKLATPELISIIRRVLAYKINMIESDVNVIEKWVWEVFYQRKHWYRKSNVFATYSLNLRNLDWK